MTDLDVSLAPGCFGISLLYRKETPECATCPFAGQCEPLALAQLARLRAEMGIVEPASKKVPKAADPTAGKLTLPVKVQELINAIDRAKLNVGEALRRGINPFTAKFPFLRITAHVLIKRQGSIKRAEIAEAIALVMKVGESTADAYALQASHALRAIGVADEINGVVRLKR